MLFVIYVKCVKKNTVKFDLETKKLKTESEFTKKKIYINGFITEMA